MKDAKQIEVLCVLEYGPDVELQQVSGSTRSADFMICRYEGEVWENCADYLRDYNAMHRVMANLSWETLHEVMVIMADSHDVHTPAGSNHVLRTKPGHMAECIIRAAGLWEEE